MLGVGVLWFGVQGVGFKSVGSWLSGLGFRGLGGF